MKAVTPIISRYVVHDPFEKQSAFMILPHFEAFYGGAAGSAKSDTLLMIAGQYLDVPGYSGLMIRRTLTEAKLPSALLDRAKQWWLPLGVHFDSNTHVFTSPEGGRVTMGFNPDANQIVVLRKPDANCDGAAVIGRIAKLDDAAPDFPLNRPAHIVKCIVNNSDNWVTNSGNNSVAALHSFRCTVAGARPVQGGGLSQPDGITRDNQGNVWIANHAVGANTVTKIRWTYFGTPQPVRQAPCLNREGTDENSEVKLEALSPPSGFTGAGLNRPYG